METQEKKYTKQDFVDRISKELSFSIEMRESYAKTTMNSMTEYYNEQIQLLSAMLVYINKRR